MTNLRMQLDWIRATSFFYTLFYQINFFAYHFFGVEFWISEFAATTTTIKQCCYRWMFLPLLYTPHTLNTWNPEWIDLSCFFWTFYERADRFLSFLFPCKAKFLYEICICNTCFGARFWHLTNLFAAFIC